MGVTINRLFNFNFFLCKNMKFNRLLIERLKLRTLSGSLDNLSLIRVSGSDSNELKT